MKLIEWAVYSIAILRVALLLMMPVPMEPVAFDSVISPPPPNSQTITITPTPVGYVYVTYVEM